MAQTTDSFATTPNPPQQIQTLNMALPQTAQAATQPGQIQTQPTQTATQNSQNPAAQLSQDEINQLTAELKAASPPALDVRPGTDLDHLKQQLGNDTRADALTAAAAKANEQITALNFIGLSPLEERYSKRANQRLEQFGYDIFTPDGRRLPAASTLGDSYVLGPGDRVMVVLRGATSNVQSYPIGDDGRVVVDNIRPITAAGRELGDVAREIESEIAGRLIDTQAYVSLSQLRAVNVQVLGEVLRPGRATMSAYGGVMDALNAAGGVRKTGSLRRLVLTHADGTTQNLDLYQLLLTGSREVDMQLKDGDRILVPPIGATLAVAGPVKRAGIYELLEQSKDVTLQQALYLAGETKPPEGMRFMRVRVDASGDEQFTGLLDPDAAELTDQDVLITEPRGDAPRRVVMVMGNVRAAGPVPLDEARTLSALLGDGANIADNTYPLMGIIERTDQKTLETTYVPFDPQHALAGKDKTPLQSGDKVKLFSDRDINTLTAQPASLTASKSNAFDSGTPDAENKENLPPAERVMADHIVTLHGAVAKPGNYPIAADTPLSDLIGAAGGITHNADRGSVEVVSFETNPAGERSPVRSAYDINQQNPKDILVPVGASVRINPKMDLVEHTGVEIDGEVARPGHYDIMRGEKLSSLIARAGGITEEAYAPGTVFMRESARRQEAAQYRIAAQQLEDSVAHAITADKANSQQIDVARQLANELRTAPAVGRITVEADPDILRLHPEEDVLLEAGDHIVVPPRRQTVSVTGEVHAPANLQFVDGKPADDYLKEAGGFTRFADEHQAFVIGPNGAAKPLRLSSWTGSHTDIVPGSTIVVPHDPETYDTLQLVNGIGNIMAQLAVSTAAIASINYNSNH